jgi:uncharacterized protein
MRWPKIKEGHGSVPPLTVMFKTVSGGCNLNCRYCYSGQSFEEGTAPRKIEYRLLEIFLRQYMEYVADAHQANLSWQGGEPTLAGLDFFRRVVALEARFARPPTTLSNSIQTNGVLINDEWAEFLAQYDFLVGVSLDGQEALHNAERKDRAGQGTFRRVMAGIEALRRHRAAFNVLCVVGQHNVTQPGTLLDFFLSESLDYLQFMPAMAFRSTEPQVPASYLITPEEYGYFLIEVFNRWYGAGVPQFSVRVFDNILQSLLGMPNDLCVHGDLCHGGLVVERNGDAYPCDFYIHPDWRLGNVFVDSLLEIAEGGAFRSFALRKRNVANRCQTCEWFRLCHGECPRNYVRGASYFCQSYQMLFRETAPSMRALAGRLANYRRYLEWRGNEKTAHQPYPSGNEACPCGSGREFRACCGDPALARSYLFQPDK